MRTRGKGLPPSSAAPADTFDPRRPLALVAPGKGGPRIVSLNAAGRHGGLSVGDLLSNARSKVLDLQSCAADPEADAAELRRLALWATRYAPIAAPWDEASGADGLFIDITGSAHLLGGEPQLLADLDRRLRAFGLFPRLAVAGTPGAAWALARHGPQPKSGMAGHVLASGAEAEALRPLPLAALRLPDATLSLLRRMGLRRIGDVIDQPRAPLAARFEALLLRLDQALGRLPEPIIPAMPPPVYRVQATFMEPITGHEHVLEAAAHLLQRLTADLARDAMGARAVRLMLFGVDGGVQTLEIGLAAPSRDARHIARLLALRLDRMAEHSSGRGDDALTADFGFEAAALHVLAAEPLADRQSRLTMDGATAAPEALPQLIDRLQQRLGRTAVYQLQPYQSHIPERANGLSPLDSALTKGFAGWISAERVTQHGARKGGGEDVLGYGPAALTHPAKLPLSAERRATQRSLQWITDIPRPLLLLACPETAEVLALMPEGPPRQFRWRRMLHRIAHAQGPERIAPEWWRQSPDDAERDYYLVEDSAGRRFWLYRAGRYDGGGTAPQWFVHGVFG